MVYNNNPALKNKNTVPIMPTLDLDDRLNHPWANDMRCPVFAHVDDQLMSNLYKPHLVHLCLASDVEQADKTWPNDQVG